MTTLVWFDSVDASERVESLALHAHSIAGYRWNGFLIPNATAAEWRRFIAAWQANDPNGTWNVAGISEHDGALFYVDGDGNEDAWRTVTGTADNGEPLYAFDGWTWHDDTQQVESR